MILFFGTRSGKTELKQLNGVTCSHCKQISTLTATKTSNWFHLFWIKLFKISSQKFVECSHCKRVYFADELTPEMSQALNRGPMQTL